MTLPNFFIAGAPKSGTTSLYHYLDQHPEIYMSRIKEPHYFASEIRLERFSRRLRPRVERDARALEEYFKGPMLERRFGGPVTEWSNYVKLFEHADGHKAIGEASVCYLWSESAAGNIRAKIPNAQIILVLRDPVEMVFSLYRHTLRSGSTQCTLREAIQMGLAQRGGELDVFHPFLDFGLYHGQVKRVLETFSHDHVRIFWYQDFQAQPLQMLAELFRFLGVDPTFCPDMSKRYLESEQPKFLPEPGDRVCLREFFRPDIEKLAGLLGRDLSDWLI
ncbi:MAG TPA: sulfotransferase [Bryobacteraceae bacterium]|nr:sulfotransferase [Bryobacteraceae bacterium]